MSAHSAARRATALPAPGRSPKGVALEERMFSMDPPFTPEHQLFRRTLRDYVERELAPHALEWDEAGIFPREIFRGMAEIGALCLHYPESVGGAGGHYLVLAELA